MEIKNGRKELLIIILILILASFFRLWQLDSSPPGLYSDEAINANQAISNPGKIFYPENNGREGLFINLISLSFKALGTSIPALRMVPGIIGILTVLGVYLLAKELFKQTSVAVFSALFLATSFWHVNFSRIGFRAILVPFFLTFSLYFLFKGFRRKKILDFIFAGIIFGLGFYSYIAFRLAILIIVPIFLIELLQNKEQKKKFFVLGAGFFLSVFLVALPIGIYFLQNPQYFSSRTGGIMVFNQENALRAFGESLVKHLAMFNFVGDYNWRHNIAGSPLLFWPVGVFFLFGLFSSLKELTLSFKEREYSFLNAHLALFSWWLIMLLPGILTHEGIPHSLRCIGAIPSVFIFAGLGMNFFIKFCKKRLITKKPNSCLIIFFAILILFSFVFAQYSRYFLIWTKNPETIKAFSQDQVSVGNYLNSLPQKTIKYVISEKAVENEKDLSMGVQTILFVEKTKQEKTETKYLSKQELNKIEIASGQKAIIVLTQYDDKTSTTILEKFPVSKVNKIFEIWIYEIN